MTTTTRFYLLGIFMLSTLSLWSDSTITFSGADWNSGNHGRTFIGGGGDEGWVIYDDGTASNNSRQQWIWMDVSEVLSQIPAGDVVASATLSFEGVRDIDDDGAAVEYRLFQVSGTDRGRAAIIAAGVAGRDGNDVPDFFAAHTGYGSIAGVGNAFGPHSFDLTAMVQGWHNGTLTMNPGQMNLLWDRLGGARNYVRWGNVDSDSDGMPPTLLIETYTPIPVIQWGQPGGDPDIVTSLQPFSQMLNTYTTGKVCSPADPALYYPNSAGRTPEFNHAANSTVNAKHVADDPAGDFIWTGKNTDEYRAMVGWDGLASGNYEVTSLCAELRVNGDVDTAEFRWFIQKSDGLWFASEPFAMSSSWGVYSNASPHMLDWFEFSPIAGGAAAVGEAADITLKNTVSVGVYMFFDNLDTIPNRGFNVRYFQAAAQPCAGIWDEALGLLQGKRTVLETLISQAETAGLVTDYARVSLQVIDDFEQFAQRDYEQHTELQAIYDVSWKSLIPQEHSAVALPFTELRKAAAVADYAIAELQQQMGTNIVLSASVDFGSGSMTISGGSYRRDGVPVFPSLLSLSSEARMDAYGRIGGLYYALTDLQSDGTLLAPPSRGPTYWDVQAAEDQVAQHIPFANIFLGNSAVASWMSANHPEVLDGARHFVGYDTDSPLIRQWYTNLFEVYMPHVCNAYGDAHHTFMLANEPLFDTRVGGWEAENGVSAFTRERYRSWLAEKYDDIAVLNAAYGTGYATFDQARDGLVLPISTALQGGPIWYDWCRFNMFRINDFFSFLKQGAQGNDPYSGPVTIKVLGGQLQTPFRDHGMDIEYLADLVDVTGSDLRCVPAGTQYFSGSERPEWEAFYAFDWIEQSIMLDFYKSLHPDKPYLDGEWHGFSTGKWRNFSISRDYVRASLWLGFTHGMNGIIPWYWGRNSDGTFRSNENIGALLTQPVALDAFGRVMKELNAHAAHVVGLAGQDRPFYLYYCEDAAIQDLTYTERLEQVYEALKLLNLRVGFTTPATIAALPADKTVIVPPTEYISEAALSALLGFTGDRVIVNGANANFALTEHGAARSAPAVPSIAEVSLEADRENLADVLGAVLNPLSPPCAVEITVTDTNGVPAYGVMAGQSTDENGATILSLINTRNEPLVVSLAEYGRDVSYRDLVTGNTAGGIQVMQPCDVRLLSTLTGWENYVEQHGLAGDPSADWDGDGMRDVEEFAHNLDPKQGNDPGDQIAFQVHSASNCASFDYVRFRLPNAGISYYPEWSGDLVSWHSNWTDIQVSPMLSNDYEAVEHVFDMDGRAKAFFRLRITQP